MLIREEYIHWSLVDASLSLSDFVVCLPVCLSTCLFGVPDSLVIVSTERLCKRFYEVRVFQSMDSS